MTHKSTLLAIAVATIISSTLFAQQTTNYINLSITENSNLSIQQTESMTLSFDQNGTDALDNFDLGDLINISLNDSDAHPFTYTNTNDEITVMDARPVLGSYTRIALGFYTKYPATIKIIANTYANSSDTTYRPAYVWIEDILSGDVYQILGDTAKLDIPINDVFAIQYYLHTGPALPKTIHNETCYHAYDGSVSITNPHMIDWDLSIYNNANLVSTSHITQQDTTISNLTAGYYTFISSVNYVNIDSVVLYVDGSSQIIPDFNVSNYNPTTSDVVSFINFSTGGLLYSWDFGDNLYDTLQNTSHQYSVAGNYLVELTAMNAAGCYEYAYDSIFVSNATQNIHQAPSFNMNFGSGDPTTTGTTAFEPEVKANQNTLKITNEQNNNEQMTVMVMNTQGQLLSTTISSDSTFEVTVPQSGIYIVNMVSSKGEAKSTTVLVAN